MTSAAEPVRADSDPHTVLGIVGAPGAAYSLAGELADTELHAELEKRLPGARWCIEVMEGRSVGWWRPMNRGGCLGAPLEPDEAVRAAAYVQHFEDEEDIEEAA